MTDVRCTGIEVWKADFPLRLTFSHNLATRGMAETFIVAVRTSAGSVGYGQCLPRVYLTGETMDSAFVDIRQRWWPAVSALRFPVGAAAAGVATLLEPVFRQADALRLAASYAPVDIAVHDALARAASRPVLPGAGGPAGRMPLVGVIGAGSPMLSAWLARLMRWLGYRHFKVKVGKDAKADAKRLAAVRKAIGKSAWLAVDANQAWSFAEARARLAAMVPFGVNVAEEPLERGLADRLDRLEKEAGIAVMADETLCTLSDAEAFVKSGGPTWWNIRLAKNGGFTGVAKLAALAKANDIRVYGGVLVGETSALAAACQASMFDCKTELMEYGFPRLFLKRDPFRGGPGGFSGTMHPPATGTLGLGVTITKKRLEKIAAPVWNAGEACFPRAEGSAGAE